MKTNTKKWNSGMENMPKKHKKQNQETRLSVFIFIIAIGFILTAGLASGAGEVNVTKTASGKVLESGGYPTAFQGENITFTI